MRLPPKWILLLIVLIEGFSVLAAELLAIRQIIPYVGNGTDIVSIIIAAVLLPLAVGNYMGGRFSPRRSRIPFTNSVRRKLLFNIIVSLIILTAGLSYPVMKMFFDELFLAGVNNRHMAAAVYSLTFLVIPVYLLGQTLPLVSHYFSKEGVQRATGKILFFSTTGSFMGSVVVTLVLMATIGVHHTVIVVIAALAIILTLLSRKILSFPILAGIAIITAAIAFNTQWILNKDHIVSNNRYNLVQLVPEDDKGTLTMILNGDLSSRFTKDETKRFAYERYINTVFFDPISDGQVDKRDILMIGAGGFMIGQGDSYNNITYVDIDDTLLKISEEQFLKKKLTLNKSFVPVPARAFLVKAKQEGKKYDMVVLDVFKGKTDIPEDMMTREFYQQVYDVLKDEGIMVGNFYLSSQFADRMSRTVDNTLQSVFGNLNRQTLSNYNAWNRDPTGYHNIIYSAYKTAPEDSKRIYTDDLNRSFLDRKWDER